jgi:nicotinate-nucleotide adenylyltransferase
MAERLGIFGGTFDPPHIGHLILAAEAYDQLGLDKVLWVVTPDPPHKHGKEIAPLLCRLNMVEAAIGNFPGFEVSKVEIDRPAPHYAVDTVKILMQMNPRAELVYLMGGDSLFDLPSWYECQEFVASCDGIGVMPRPKADFDLNWLETQIPGIRLKVKFVETPGLGISASQIRKKIKSGQTYRFYLSPAVYQIIVKEKLYQ